LALGQLERCRVEGLASNHHQNLRDHSDEESQASNRGLLRVQHAALDKVKMKNIRNKETCGQFFELGSTGWRSYEYSKFVDIKDDRGNIHQCCCIDEDTAKLISSLPKRKFPPVWSLDYWYKSQTLYACRDSLTVRETEHGYFVFRRRRSNGHLAHFMLAHQLTNSPVIFPSLGFAQAAAELCYPKPNRALGYLWWTYPNILV
jgi:hypothetical protein